MGILCIFLWVALATYAIADDSCPAAEDIAPCTCDGEGLNCMGPRTIDDVKKAFRAKFKYGGIRSVWIQGTPIKKLPADTFGDIKSQQFYVEVNELTDIDVKAFSGSKKTLSTLSLFGNKLTSFDYSGLSVYENLGTLNLGRNEITEIPDNAFNSKTLFNIILAQNKIKHIGENAFANLPSLGKLELALNRLTALGPLSFASKGHSAALQINLQANRISEVSSTAFDGCAPYALLMPNNKLTSLPSASFGKVVERIAQKGGFMDVSRNDFSCTGCDYSWLVLNKELLRTRLLGFMCDDGRTLNDLTKSGIRCKA